MRQIRQNKKRKADDANVEGKSKKQIRKDVKDKDADKKQRKGKKLTQNKAGKMGSIIVISESADTTDSGTVL